MRFRTDQELIDALTLSLSLLANIVDRQEIFDDDNVRAQVQFARTLIRWSIERSNIDAGTKGRS